MFGLSDSFIGTVEYGVPVGESITEEDELKQKKGAHRLRAMGSDQLFLDDLCRKPDVVFHHHIHDIGSCG